jgi:hypothetical protein
VVDPGLVDLLEQRCHRLRAADVTGGEVEGELDIIRPGASRLQRLAEQGHRDLSDRPCLLRRADEDIRRDPTEHRIIPARQRLEANGTPVAVDDRLVLEVKGVLALHRP